MAAKIDERPVRSAGAGALPRPPIYVDGSEAAIEGMTGASRQREGRGPASVSRRRTAQGTSNAPLLGSTRPGAGASRCVRAGVGTGIPFAVPPPE